MEHSEMKELTSILEMKELTSILEIKELTSVLEMISYFFASKLPSLSKYPSLPSSVASK